MIHNKESMLGFALGFILSLAILFLIAVLMKKKNGTGKYDERQELARGKAYKYAFFVLMIYSCLNGLFNLISGINWSDTISGNFIGICLSVTVFACVCLFKDAYFSVREKPGFYISLFSIIAIVNIAAGVINLLEKDNAVITDGQLNYHSINLIVGIMFIIILVAAVIKLLNDKKLEKTE